MRPNIKTQNEIFFQGLIKSISMTLNCRPCIIGVSGAGGVGKTTTGELLEAYFGKEKCISIDGDNYLRYERQKKLEKGLTGYNPKCNRMDLVREHLIELRECRPILKPVYDLKDGTFLTEERIEPKKIIIISGVIALYEELADLLDISVFLDASEETQIQTRMKRDTTQRDYTREQVIENMKQFSRDFDLYLGPSKENASIVCDVDADHVMRPVRIEDRFSRAWAA